MTLDLDDVIAAVATPAGPAERSVIRLSGAGVVQVLRLRFAGVEAATPGATSHLARRTVGQYYIDGWRVPVPVDLWLWPTARSYTGQPSAELHLIGSPPLVDALLEQLYRDGVRPARAGEFTLRAFLAGRVDLVQAEAVLGVIDATDHQQLETALAQLAGGLSRQIAEIREALLLDLADLEAGLDFVDEDIEFVQREQMRARIAAALALAERLRQQSGTRMVSGSRPRVVLAGLPNAGKSTLFNRLVGEQRAIVSDQAGTTRDYLSAELNWGGLAIELVDTAGVDSHSLGVAAQAESLRQVQVSRADLVVWCSSLAGSAEEAALDEAAYHEALRAARECVRVWTKSDEFCLLPGPLDSCVFWREGEASAMNMIEGGLFDVGHVSYVPVSASIGAVSPPRLERPLDGDLSPDRDRPHDGSFDLCFAQVRHVGNVPHGLGDALAVSALTGSGLDALRAEVTRRFSLQAAHRGEWLATTAARSRDALDRCVTGLRLAESAAEQHHGDELISLELRGALDALGEICGAVHTDDILDRIFSRFCIGK